MTTLHPSVIEAAKAVADYQATMAEERAWIERETIAQRVRWRNNQAAYWARRDGEKVL